MVSNVPSLCQVVLDGTDIRALAEFWRELLGLHYRPGDEQPSDDEGWLVLRDAAGLNRLAFQRVDRLAASTWPDDSIPQQLHLDLSVATPDDLLAQHDRALALGARLVFDRFDDPAEPLRVYADPAGHPFCIFAAHAGI